MSWGLNQPCYKCKREDKCIDAQILEGAIYAIHRCGPYPIQKGHYGGGTLEMKCNNLEPKEEK